MRRWKELSLDQQRDALDLLAEPYASFNMQTGVSSTMSFPAGIREDWWARRKAFLQSVEITSPAVDDSAVETLSQAMVKQQRDLYNLSLEIANLRREVIGNRDRG